MQVSGVLQTITALDELVERTRDLCIFGRGERGILGLIKTKRPEGVFVERNEIRSRWWGTGDTFNLSGCPNRHHHFARSEGHDRCAAHLQALGFSPAPPPILQTVRSKKKI